MNQQPSSELLQGFQLFDPRALRERLACETNRPTEPLFSAHYAQMIETGLQHEFEPTNLSIRIKLDQTT